MHPEGNLGITSPQTGSKKARRKAAKQGAEGSGQSGEGATPETVMERARFRPGDAWMMSRIVLSLAALVQMVKTESVSMGYLH